MKTFNYSGFVCPQCKSPDIEPLGEPTFSPAKYEDGERYPDTWYQIFTHPNCEKINQITGFTRWTYDITDREIK